MNMKTIEVPVADTVMEWFQSLTEEQKVAFQAKLAKISLAESIRALIHDIHTDIKASGISDEELNAIERQMIDED